MFRLSYAAAVAATAVVAGACASPPAQAGEWRLDPRRCPDLVEDYFDRQVVRGARDLHEDIHDERRVDCPASAWVWVGGHGRHYHARPARPRYNVIYVRPGGHYHYRNHRGARVRVNIHVHR